MADLYGQWQSHQRPVELGVERTNVDAVNSLYLTDLFYVIDAIHGPARIEVSLPAECVLWAMIRTRSEL